MKKLVLILTLLVIFSSFAVAKVVYVDNNEDGISWNKYNDCYLQASQGNDFNDEYCYMESGNLKFKDDFYKDASYTEKYDDFDCSGFELNNYPFKNYLEQKYNYNTGKYEYEFDSGLYKHLDFVYYKYNCAPKKEPVLIYDPDDYESTEVYYAHPVKTSKYYNMPYYGYDDPIDYYNDKYWYYDNDNYEWAHHEKYWHKTKDLKKFKYYKKGFKDGYNYGYKYYDDMYYDFPHQVYKYNPKVKKYYKYYN